MRLFSSGRYASVTATLALITAMGGTSYAAVTIANNSVGTPQLQANAVTSGKVKNGTLLKRDFKAGQLPAGAKGATGATGATGASGAAGAAGAVGPIGPSNAITKVDAGYVTWSAAFATQQSVTLTAGSWVVTATGLGNNNSGAAASMDCRLLVGGASVDSTEGLTLAATGTPAERLPFSLSGAATLAADGLAELQCMSGSAGNVGQPSIVAIRVGAVATQ